MTTAEAELQAIIDGLRPKPANAEKLITELLVLKSEKKRENAGSAEALSSNDVIKKMVQLFRAIDDAQDLFADLHGGNLLLHDPLPMKVSYPSRYKINFEKDRTHSLESGSIADEGFSWFPDVLETMKGQLKERVYDIVKAQPTEANLKPIYLVVAAKCCHDAGIKFSTSENSQFYKIARWFLGQEDPRRTLRKVKPLVLRVMKDD